MNVLVIENERPAADRIIKMLKKTEKSVNIAGVVETVEEAINRLQMKPEPDLILMDIQLDDGLCFEIFETINIDIPVIFVTAYDEYMLKAFKVNSVDYLLKPVDEGSLKSAIEKFKKLHFNNEDPFKRDFKPIRVCAMGTPRLRVTVESVRSRCNLEIGSLADKCSKMALATPRLPSEFSKSMGLTLCGMADEPTSPFFIFCLKYSIEI